MVSTDCSHQLPRGRPRLQTATSPESKLSCTPPMASLRWLLTGRYEQAKLYRLEAGHHGCSHQASNQSDCLKAPLAAAGACPYEPLAAQESLSKAQPATGPSFSAQTVERHTVVLSQVSARDTDGSGASLCRGQRFSIEQPSLGALEVRRGLWVSQ